MDWTLNRAGSRPIPIPWKLREDIQWFSRGTDHGEWIAKDPLSTKFYRFGAEERKLLDWIDGQRSIAEIEEKFHSEFRPKHIDRQELIRLLQTAIQRGLLTFRGRPSDPLSDSPTQGLLTWLTALPWKLLFSRISLGNPQKWLDHPWLKMNWLFSHLAIRVWLTLTIATLCLLLSRWSDLWTRWPSWQQLMQPSTWLGMGTAFVLTRSIHELSHAVVCRRFGARCSDVGLLFMSGIVCPYVDVSDSWRLSDRWHRAAIAMAGVYAELIVGSLAGLFWLLTYESWINYFAFQIMLVCTISTLLFNANPLMRYDGYYTLCDLLETPNLRERADRVVGRLGASLFLGIQPAPLWNRGNLFLLLFGSLATCYRFLFLFGMMNAVIASARYWNVPWLGWSIAMLIVVSALLIPLYRALQFTLRSWRHENFRRGRAVMSWMAFVILFVLATILPVPVRVPGFGVVVPADRVSVFAPSTGWIEPEKSSESNPQSDPSSNMLIAEHQTILRLENEESEAAVLLAAQRVAEIDQELALAHRQSFHDQAAMTRIPILEATMLMARKQLQAKQEQLQQLSILSPSPGVWRAAPTQEDVSLVSGATPVRWLPGEAMQQRGRWVRTGELLGWVDRSDDWVVESFVDEDQLAHIHLGSQARVVLHQRPGDVYSATVVQIEQLAHERDVEALNGQALDPSKRTTTNLQPSEMAPRSTYRIGLKVEGLDETEKLLCEGKASFVITARSQSMILIARDWFLRNVRM